MKKSILVLLVLLTGCAEKPLDEQKAKEVVSQLIKLSDEGDYNAVENLYTAEFNSSEPFEIKREKLERLRNSLGPVKSVEFISVTHVAEFGMPQQAKIVCRVQHQNINTIETFSVQEDEGGYRVASHKVESENNAT
jgi:hypothetical protein